MQQHGHTARAWAQFTQTHTPQAGARARVLRSTHTHTHTLARTRWQDILTNLDSSRHSSSEHRPREASRSLNVTTGVFSDSEADRVRNSHGGASRCTSKRVQEHQRNRLQVPLTRNVARRQFRVRFVAAHPAWRRSSCVGHSAWRGEDGIRFAGCLQLIRLPRLHECINQHNARKHKSAVPRHKLKARPSKKKHTFFFK